MHGSISARIRIAHLPLSRTLNPHHASGNEGQPRGVAPTDRANAALSTSERFRDLSPVISIPGGLASEEVGYEAQVVTVRQLSKDFARAVRLTPTIISAASKEIPANPQKTGR